MGCAGSAKDTMIKASLCNCAMARLRMQSRKGSGHNEAWQLRAHAKSALTQPQMKASGFVNT